MSYIPDYRHETDKFDDLDKEYIAGYRAALQDVQNALANLEDEGVEKDCFAECLTEELEMREINLVCAMFDQDKYEFVEITDGNPPLYTGTKGAEDKV